MKGTFFLVILAFFMSYACSGSSQVKSSENTMLLKIVNEKFPQNNSILINKTNTFALCLNNGKKHSEGPVNFFIYSLKSDKIIHEDSISQGSVKWLNDNQVEVKTIPGIVKGGEADETVVSGYIYDLNLQQKLSINKTNHLK